MSVAQVLRGSAWLYVAGILSNFLGYLYWLLASKLVDPAVIGSAVAAIGFATITTSLISLSVPTGVQRFLGKSHAERNMVELSTYFHSSLSYLLLLTAIPSMMLASIILLQRPILGFTIPQLCFALAILLTGSGGWTALYYALYNSTLKTHVNALASITSSAARLAVGLALLYAGLEFTGVASGYLAAYLAADLVYIAYSAKWLKPQLNVSHTHFKQVVQAGLASWIPNLINVAGQWMGLVGLYAMVGGVETGLYYMAYAIAMVIYTLPSSLLSLMFPVLSGMTDGRKRAAHRATRLSIAASTPLAIALIAYPRLPLSMLGPAYLPAETSLRILLLGVLASPVLMGFTSLIYAYGHYRQVTILGLVGNASRIMLYPYLTATMAETGVAIAYTTGILTSLAAAVPMALKTGYQLPWLETLEATAVPLAAAATCLLLKTPWTLGVPLTLLSTLLYPKLGLVARTDIAEASTALLPRRIVSAAYPYAKRMLDQIYGE